VLVEGTGAYTIVNGEKCSMEKGDLILTPGGMWHDHGHDGTEPVIWLDALDLPLFVYLEGSYAEERDLQAPRNRPDASAVEYLHAGLVPTRRAGTRDRLQYPMLRYPWKNTRRALEALAEHSSPTEPVELDFVNPETGDSCLPTLGFTAMMLNPSSNLSPPLQSSSAVFHVIDGRGRSRVNGETFDWGPGDTFSAPVFAELDHTVTAGSSAFMIRIHDRPLQEKLGYFEERQR
jgi:gentisate 1,2-dioxygenase